MSGGDLPPRQKMIGMMYLVLTALLALNISKSILDAFIKLNTGIEKTTTTFDASNGIIYNQFDKARTTGGENGKKWAGKADQVKTAANELYDHIKKLKAKLIEKTDALPPEVADTIQIKYVNAKDNYDVPSHLMGLAEPSNPIKVKGEEEWSALTLEEKIDSYYKTIVGVFDDKDVAKTIEEKTSYLKTDPIKNTEGKEEPWTVASFYHAPLAATITMLSKIQADIRTSEAEVINKLYERIDAGGVSFNKVRGMAVLPKAYLMQGDTFRADIFTAAYDDRVDPEIYISKVAYDTAAMYKAMETGEFDISKIMTGQKGTNWNDGDWYQMDEKNISGGIGQLAIQEGVGLHNWGGIIKLDTKKGPKIYPFTSSFEVGTPSFAVSADKMNVFYMGVENPVSISAPMPKFTASAPGLSKSGKGWVMKPRKPGKVKITVTGEDEVTGEKVNVGSAEFRVKRIPTPTPFIAGKTGTVVLSKSQLGDGVIQAKLEGFVFDLKVKVSSFTLGTTVSGDYKEVKCNGNRMNSKAKSLVKRGSRGQRFYLEKMQVKMPDGRRVTMGNMTVKLR